MPTARFKVVVMSQQDKSNEALVEAGQYLAYADQTDTFGYHGKVTASQTQLAADAESYDWWITLTFNAPVARQEDIDAFMRECETLARVKDAECLSNPTVA